MATAEKPPAFQLYPRDFVADLDVAAMSLEELGAYFLLLCHGWLKDGLPNDEQKLLRLLSRPRTRGRSLADVWAAVEEKFPVAPDGRRRNARQEEVRAEQALYRESQSERGRKGAEARHGHSRSTAQALPEHSSSTPQAVLGDGSAPAPASTSPIGDVSTDAGFADFWAAYPRHEAKKPAQTAWRTLKPSARLREIILADVATRAASHDWRKERGRFIPLPTTYLHQRRWEDEGVAVDEPRSVSWKDTCHHHPACGSYQEHEQRLVIDARQVTT